MLAAGCGGGSKASDEILMGDGFRFTMGAPTEDLTATPIGPYQVGATLTLRAHVPDRYKDDADLEFYSTGEQVLSVEPSIIEGNELSAKATAVTEGETRIQVWKGNQELVSSAVEVTSYDTVDAVAADPYLLGRFDLAVPQSSYHVFQDKRCAFRLRYLKDDAEIFGTGRAFLAAADTVQVEQPEFYGDVEGEWVIFRPGNQGEILNAATIEYFIDNVRLGTINLTIDEDVTAVQELELVTNGEADAAPGDTVEAGLLGYDVDGEMILGLEPTWTFDGKDDTKNPYPVFSYTYDPDASVDVKAVAQSLEVKGEIHEGDGRVDPAGCATMPRSTRPMGYAAILVGLAASLARRRTARPFAR